MKKYDVIIIGAGAAGLSAGRTALNRGKSVLILDMGNEPARKVFVSGGGRCNFTNMAASYDRYFGQNPEFVRSALAQVKPVDILDWMESHNLSWVEKAPGQFFCATGSTDVVNALMNDVNGADIKFNTMVNGVEKNGDEFSVFTDNESFTAKSVIVATGGISYPNLGVSDAGHIIAKQFGHKIIPVEAGLVGLKTNLFSPDLAGISMDVEITIGKKKIRDGFIFTHFGIGGPAVYRASMYNLNNDFYINFAPKLDMYESLRDAKGKYGKKSITAVLSLFLPSNFTKWFVGDMTENIADVRDKDLMQIAQQINHFHIPGGTLKRRGFLSAEVVMGGVSTADVSSKTMESKKCPGLFFAGEVLDIAGDLGGFNLHFAWASGIVAGMNA